MAFEYVWHRQEANFGPVIKREVEKGTHFTIENILRFQDSFVALRRPEAVPHHEVPKRALNAGKPLLYFVHDLPIWGESLSQFVNRIVAEQAGVSVKSFKVIDLVMNIYEDSQQWALTPYVVVELRDLPTIGNFGNQVTEVVTFTKDTIPDEFGWYEKDEIETLLQKIQK